MKQKLYIKNLEKELGKQIKQKREFESRMHDWTEAAFDYSEEAHRKDKLATQLFIIGLLLGGHLASLIAL